MSLKFVLIFILLKGAPLPQQPAAQQRAVVGNWKVIDYQVQRNRKWHSIDNDQELIYRFRRDGTLRISGRKYRRIWKVPRSHLLQWHRDSKHTKPKPYTGKILFVHNTAEAQVILKKLQQGQAPPSLYKVMVLRRTE